MVPGRHVVHGARGILVVDPHQVVCAAVKPVIAAVYREIADGDRNRRNPNTVDIWKGLHKDLGCRGLATRISIKIGGVYQHTAARRYDHRIVLSRSG